MVVADRRPGYARRSPRRGCATAQSGHDLTENTGVPIAGRSRHRTSRMIGWSAAAALLVFVTVILVLFFVFNTQTVTVNLVFGNVQASLVVALLAAAVLGGLVVGLAGAVLHGRRKKP
jgi:uncharacterized integral membrane protein